MAEWPCVIVVMAHRSLASISWRRVGIMAAPGSNSKPRDTAPPRAGAASRAQKRPVAIILKPSIVAVKCEPNAGGRVRHRHSAHGESRRKKRSSPLITRESSNQAARRGTLSDRQ